MISDARLREVKADPSIATQKEIAELCSEIERWRPLHELVQETLKAIWLNAKEETNRTLLLDVIMTAARSAMRRMKMANRGM